MVSLVSNIKLAPAIKCKPRRLIELALDIAFFTECGNKAAGRIEDLNSVIAAVGNI